MSALIPVTKEGVPFFLNRFNGFRATGNRGTVLTYLTHAVGVSQPGGLQDNNQWSQTTGKSIDCQHPEGVLEVMLQLTPKAGTPSGCEPTTTLSGGLRFASTSGYFLRTLQVEVHLLYFQIAKSGAPLSQVGQGAFDGLQNHRKQLKRLKHSLTYRRGHGG